jgi:uroporphyrinogen III methyltransferase/synthase
LKVIITRPLAQAQTLAARVERAGYEALIQPAIAISPVLDGAPLDAALARLESFQLVVFVSPNAVDGALARLHRPWPASVAIGVMGPGSVAALAAHGLMAPDCRIFVPPGAAEVEQPRFDSEALFDQIQTILPPGARVLIIKGNGGRPWLAQRLASIGCQVELAESYRREKPRVEAAVADIVRQLVAAQQPASVLVTSSEGLDNLQELIVGMAGAAGLNWLRACALLVPHARIAENATAAGFRRVVLTGPGDENIVRALESQGQ